MRHPLLAVAVFASLILPLKSVDDPTLETNPETHIDTTPSKTPLPPVPNANTLLTFNED